jgi:hypothetical protein
MTTYPRLVTEEEWKRLARLAQEAAERPQMPPKAATGV